MPSFLVTLSREEIIAAVSEWAERHHGIKARKVNVTAEMEWIGNGANEQQVPVPKVTLET